MCGIAGYFHFQNDRKADLSRLKQMTNSLAHRGPDGEGFLVKDNLALGHRRLSIIDLETGNQPMFSHDGKFAIIFNGEIYNYLELREELKSLGHMFKTQSDTEVIIEAYRQWGVDCQKKLNGMWAFALWDAVEKCLILSRDRVGEKPLHFAKHDNSLIFSSEIKALFEYGVPRVPVFEMLEVYLVFTYIPEPHTFYKNIEKLEAGHFLIVSEDGITKSKYWDIPEIDENNLIKNKQDVYDNFEALFSDSVKIRMRSDVPYGAFLSGGLDSSSVVAKMSELSPYPIETFTIGFDDRAFDESLLAKEVADQFNTNHHRDTVDPEDFYDILRYATHYFDEPFGDSSAIPTSQVSKQARRKIKMALTGDGGDEVLSGYNSYLGLKISQKINSLPRQFTHGLSKSLSLASTSISGRYRYKINKIVSVLETSRLPFESRMLLKKPFAELDIIKKLTGNLKGVRAVEDYYHELNSKIPYKNDFYRMMYLSIKHELPNDYLVKIDRMSMSHSLETRTPFLDHRLLEYMVGVDKSVKIQGWETKSVLRNSIGKTLPRKLLKAPKKGFGVPLREWFKKDQFKVDMKQFSTIADLLDKGTLNQVVDLNASGYNDHGNFIWTLLMLNSQMKDSAPLK